MGSEMCIRDSCKILNFCLMHGLLKSCQEAEKSRNKLGIGLPFEVEVKSSISLVPDIQTDLTDKISNTS